MENRDRPETNKTKACLAQRAYAQRHPDKVRASRQKYLNTKKGRQAKLLGDLRYKGRKRFIELIPKCHPRTLELFLAIPRGCAEFISGNQYFDWEDLAKALPSEFTYPSYEDFWDGTIWPEGHFSSLESALMRRLDTKVRNEKRIQN